MSSALENKKITKVYKKLKETIDFNGYPFIGWFLEIIEGER